jgi:hypothetical protein
VPGYPIRTPSDQRSVDSSPRTIAASHVLHRLLMPRHPPCALDNLTNTHIKKSRHKHATETKDARVHCTILNDHTNRHPTPPNSSAGRRSPQRTQQSPRERGPGCPLRTQQRAAPKPFPHRRRASRTVWCFHFSRATPSHPRHTAGEPASSGEVLGPSTTRYACTEHSPVNTPTEAVFGEAP